MPTGWILGPKLCSCKDAWALFWALIGPLLGFVSVRSSLWRCWVKTHGTHNYNVIILCSRGTDSKLIYVLCPVQPLTSMSRLCSNNVLEFS